MIVPKDLDTVLGFELRYSSLGQRIHFKEWGEIIANMVAREELVIMRVVSYKELLEFREYKIATPRPWLRKLLRKKEVLDASTKTW